VGLLYSIRLEERNGERESPALPGTNRLGGAAEGNGIFVGTPFRGKPTKTLVEHEVAFVHTPGRAQYLISIVMKTVFDKRIR
jgi:hypothetical protein